MAGGRPARQGERDRFAGLSGAVASKGGSPSGTFADGGTVLSGYSKKTGSAGRCGPGTGLGDV